MEPLTTEIITVLAVICVAIFLFVVEWVRVDVVAIMVMVSLPLLNLITGSNFIKPEQTFSGFSSNAVISIIAVIIVGAGLDKTGLVNKIVEPLLKMAGRSPSRLIMFIASAVSVISSFMQNIGAAALFLPAIKRAASVTKTPISQLLMPIGFAAILGGTMTLVGSSPLILLNDLLQPFGLEPFGMFDVTPIGLALAVSGITLFVVFGRFILPKRISETKTTSEGDSSGELLSSYQDIKGPFELQAPAEYKGTTVRELREEHFVRVVAMADPSGERILSPIPDETIGPNTNIVVYGFERHIKAMAKIEGMVLKDNLEAFSTEMSANICGVAEAVISPRSDLVGKTLHQVSFQKLYNVTPIALYRNGQIIYSVLVDVPLQTGDAILLQGSWERLKILQKYRDLIFSTPVEVDTLKPEKAFWAATWFAVAMVMIIVFKIKLSVCLMTGMLGLILTKVLTIDEAYEAVDWRTIFLLAGLIPLGIATEQSGTAKWIATSVLGIIGAVSPIVLYAVIAILSTIFSLVISNVGATVLLVPLVIVMAQQAGADPRMAALIVGIATSNSFILPTHQVNALYMGPGQYKSVDFIKAGTVLSLLFFVVLIAMIYLLKQIGFF